MSDVFIPANAGNCLSYLLKNGHHVEYQCLHGYCGSCRSQLISGDVTYREEPLAFLDKDQFLPCCSSPATDIVVKIGL